MVVFSTPFFGGGFLKIIPRRIIVKLQTIIDERGQLTVIERLPFGIKRVYYQHHVDPTKERKGHAHRELRRLMVVVSGGVTVTVRDGKGYRDVRLNDPTMGMLIEPLQWLELHHYDPGTVVLVLASMEHDEADCIRDFAEFKALAK